MFSLYPDSPFDLVCNTFTGGREMDTSWASNSLLMNRVQSEVAAEKH